MLPISVWEKKRDHKQAAVETHHVRSTQWHQVEVSDILPIRIGDYVILRGLNIDGYLRYEDRATCLGYGACMCSSTL